MSQSPRDKLCLSSEKMTKNLYCAFKKPGRLGSIERWEQLTHTQKKSPKKRGWKEKNGICASCFFWKITHRRYRTTRNRQMWLTNIPGFTWLSHWPQQVPGDCLLLIQEPMANWPVQFSFQDGFHTLLPGYPRDRSLLTSLHKLGEQPD